MSKQAADMVVGFAFDDLGRVALIKKNRPAWQAGRYNGVGGKVDPSRDALFVDAMGREFFEETGVQLMAERWKYIGLMSGIDWRVHVFTAIDERVRAVKTMESEEVALFAEAELPTLPTIENIPLLLEHCRLRLTDPDNDYPFLHLAYQ